MNVENWEYETKCRRCGSFYFWFFCERNRMEQKTFDAAIYSYLENPRTYRCEKCQRYTVQDVVWCSDYNDDRYQESFKVESVEVAKKTVSQFFWKFVHNVIAHPLLETGFRWADRFHNWTADKM